jgi:aspartate 1-decarboxylase
MVCHIAFNFIAYNVDLHKIERVKIINCNDGDKIYTIPKNRGCGFNIIDGKKYWYCYIINKRR